MRRMLVNACISFWRPAARREHAVSGQALGRVTQSWTAPDVPGQVDDREVMLALLRRLPAKQRAVLVLRHYEGLPDAEVAALTGTSVQTVRSNVHRGLAGLWRMLTELEGDRAMIRHDQPLPPAVEADVAARLERALRGSLSDTSVDVPRLAVGTRTGVRRAAVRRSVTVAVTAVAVVAIPVALTGAFGSLGALDPTGAGDDYAAATGAGAPPPSGWAAVRVGDVIVSVSVDDDAGRGACVAAARTLASLVAARVTSSGLAATAAAGG